MSSGPLKLEGLGVSPGAAVGRAFVLDAKRVRTPRTAIDPDNVPKEWQRFDAALQLSEAQLEQLKGKLAKEQDRAILEAHRMMLFDPMFVDDVKKVIERELVNVEWAIRRVVRKLRHQFDNIEDEYFRERRADVQFVADRVVRNLLGEDNDADVQVPVGAIVVAHDISPAAAALLVQHSNVLGFVTDLGGHTSHTAIVARARDVPAVVGLGHASTAIHTGDMVAVNGDLGIVWVHPTEEQIQSVNDQIQAHKKSNVIALETATLDSVTTDGFRVRLYGNMEFVEEVPVLLAHGAEGVGLFRTEFLFLNRSEPPSEEEHYTSYRYILESMGDRPVTIRTLDLGGDKVPGGKRPEKENNPAMGLRAIRYCLSHRDLFRSQLRALLRASVHGNLRVMFPMISGLSELREARSELEMCRTELGRQGLPMGKRFPVGIMVETPSAAWMADRLAQEADFFSIGTNDLIQYTLAMDRQNKDVAYLYRPLHLSVLRTLEHVVRAAQAANIPVSICGEMAGEPLYTVVLLALGFSELSMTAGQMPRVKGTIRQWSRAQALQVLKRAMEFSTAEEIERFVRAETLKAFPAV